MARLDIFFFLTRMDGKEIRISIAPVRNIILLKTYDNNYIILLTFE